MRHTPQRRVPLPYRRSVLGRERGPRGREPPQHAIEVGAPGRRAALDHDQPVGREDQRRHLSAQLLRCAQARPVQARPLATAELERHLQLDGHAGAVAAERDPCCIAAEPHELLIGPRPRREALRPHVQRLEQVRLAGSVGPGHQDEPRLQLEVELGVRAKVSERNRADDQP